MNWPSVPRSDKTPVPPILYRYYGPHRIDVIEGLSIRFSQPTRFNDTFDTEFRAVSPDPKARFRLRTKLGIFCLTQNPDSHLMWVNYALQHTGFVIGFDMTNDFWANERAIPSKVTYIDIPPKLPVGVEPSAELSLVKSTVWKYEEEWRCVREFGLSESRDIAFPNEMIAEVILGSKMESHHIARLLDTVGAYSSVSPIRVYESKPDRNTWSFVHATSTKHSCETCNGRGYL